MPSLPVPEDLERDGIALRRLRARDAGAFAGAFREDPTLGVLIGADEDPTENSVRRFIARQPGLRARGEFLGLAVSDASKRPFLGHVMLHTLAWRHRRAEVGYWLVPSARGQGIGRTAVSLLVEWAFEELELDRVEITTTPDNAAARALARSLGFTQEGVLASRNLERGRRVDVVILARLRK
jgi:RimJ/RimL family protein N-acetyltransferase